MTTTPIKRTLACIIGLASLTQFSFGNQISDSQQRYIKQYEKQANIPNPENMLINTDPEPDLGKGVTPLYNGKDLAGWTPLGGKCTFEAKGDTYKTWINGIPAAHLKDGKYSQGFFSLQIHHGKEGTVHFRNINVKEL